MTLREKTKQQLVSFCKQQGWPGYSNKRKDVLIHWIQTKQIRLDRAARMIQRWFREVVTKVVMINDDDFYTLEPFTAVEILFHFREADSRSMYRFRPKSLILYMLTTGVFENPYTRSVFTVVDLQDLQRAYSASINTSDTRTLPPTDQIHFQLNNTSVLFATTIELSTFQPIIAIERRVVRETQELVDFISLDATNAHEAIIELVVNAVTEDLNTIVFALVHICDYHFPRIEQTMVHLLTLDQQPVMSGMIATFTLEAASIVQGFRIRRYLVDIYTTRLLRL